MASVDLLLVFLFCFTCILGRIVTDLFVASPFHCDSLSYFLQLFSLTSDTSAAFNLFLSFCAEHGVVGEAEGIYRYTAWHGKFSVRLLFVYNQIIVSSGNVFLLSWPCGLR